MIYLLVVLLTLWHMLNNFFDSKMSSILLLNQVAGPLFRELAEDLAIAFDGMELLSGYLEDLTKTSSFIASNLGTSL